MNKRKYPVVDDNRNVILKDINSILKRNTISPKCWYFSPSGQIVWWQYINKSSKSSHRSDKLKYKCSKDNIVFIIDNSNNVFALSEMYKFPTFKADYILENLEIIPLQQLLDLISGSQGEVQC